MRALRATLPPGVERRLLLDAFAPQVDLFHGLNQRLPKRKRGRHVVTFHDLFSMTEEFSTPEFRARFTQLARDAAERADGIIAVSEFTAGQVRDLLGVQASRIRVIPHGVDPAKPSTSQDRMILHVGAIQKRKNLVRLIQAFETLPAGWKLVLAGGSGYGAEEVFQRISRSARRSDIDTPGYVSAEELERLYDRAAIFAFPSLGEGFGIPILEAMARGIPVVTARRTATAEAAGDGAMLVDAEDGDALSSALLQLTASEELRARLRLQGLQRAMQFPWSRTVQETRHFYSTLL